MANVGFPPTLDPTGSNTDADGIILGFRFFSHDDTPILGLYWRSDFAINNCVVNLYSIGGNGLGDGTVKATIADADIIVGDNFIPFGAPVVPVPDTQYAIAVKLPAGGQYGFVAAGTSLDDGSYYTHSDGYSGVFIDSSGALPSTLTITTGNSVDSPWNDSLNWYGIGVYHADGSATYDPITTWTVDRTTDVSATLTWSVADAINGVSVLRSPGVTTVDGNGNAFGEAGYDPITIAGSSIVAVGVTSPYVDTGLDAETEYTYALVRTGGGA